MKPSKEHLRKLIKEGYWITADIYEDILEQAQKNMNQNKQNKKKQIQHKPTHKNFLSKQIRKTSRLHITNYQIHQRRKTLTIKPYIFFKKEY